MRSTNVLPGQLAYINRAPGVPFALGLAVLVCHRSKDVEGKIAWAVRVSKRLTVRDGKTGQPCQYVNVPDEWMTTIAYVGVKNDA
ncbi:hypothetical protein [Caballeronia sp. AZ10_KS36]|uniref:hypothetical protein n=1 Tax=Caballeronia sp. AZ10_KS36 TaxID=2921757 RepID=UPI0020294416|nr:hypothetical protein [Caballeronia sp. AZ10_KS36]